MIPKLECCRVLFEPILPHSIEKVYSEQTRSGVSLRNSTYHECHMTSHSHFITRLSKLEASRWNSLSCADKQRFTLALHNSVIIDRLIMRYPIDDGQDGTTSHKSTEQRESASHAYSAGSVYMDSILYRANSCLLHRFGICPI